MGALFSRLKTWVSTEEVTYSDLNAEFDNVLTNLTAANVDDYSANVSQMQTVADPGEVGSESLATSVAGEIARLRKLIAEITGKTHWYESPSNSLSSIAVAIGGGLPNNRIVSGRMRSESSQPIFLVPDGGARTVRVDGTPTNFIYYINGTQYTISSDTTLTSLTAAPSTNNTCLVNDAGLTGQESSKYVGEFGSEIVVDTAGSEITALTGKLAAFKVGTEYFIARVKSSTRLSEVRRGYFFDSADAPFSRVALTDNDTITLMKLAWIYAKTDLTLTVCYTEPRYGKDEPIGPATGDYWFDTANNVWKIYNATTWDSASVHLIGCCVVSSSACVAARSFNFFAAYSDDNTLDLAVYDNTEVRSKAPGGIVNVYGTPIKYENDLARWDIDTDLDSGLTEAASTVYFLYITEDGESIISTVGPMDRMTDMGGLYHPYQIWRCVGQIYNNASSNIELVIPYSNKRDDNIAITNAVSGNALTVHLHRCPALPLKFRSATAANGDYTLGNVLPATSLTITSGSTLGTTSATSEAVHAGAVLYAGRGELSLGKKFAAADSIVTTVAEGGAGAADNDYAIYTIAARSSVPLYPVGRFRNKQTTAGTWAAVLTRVSSFPFGFGGNFDIKVYTAEGTTTWYKHDGLKRIIAFTTGAGGGGGGADSNGTTDSGGGGGGAGATCIEVIDADDLGATESVVIGAAGTVGSAAGGTGGTGGSSTFGSFHTAVGGTGGYGSTNGGGEDLGQGGAGGTTSTGLINLSGGAGTLGTATGGAAGGGTGGSSFWGGGGLGGYVTAAGVAAGGTGNAPGSGGGGGANVDTAAGTTGGLGASGFCVVVEFY